MRELNLDHLRAFAEVVELGSFSAAAERLALTQPAVSLQVRRLEKRFGVRLVERVGRRATATAAGAELLAHARIIDGAVGGAADAMARHAEGSAGRVRLGTGATACTYLLPAPLRALRQRFPGLEIVVSTGNTAQVLRALEDNRLDVGLVTLPAAGRMFELTPLRDDEFVAIAEPGVRLPRVLTPAVLARHPLVLYEPGANTRRLVDEWFARAGVEAKPVMQLGSVEAIKELVTAGLGCGVLPALAVRDAATAGSLQVRTLRPRLRRRLALVLRRDKPISWGLRELLKALTGGLD